MSIRKRRRQKGWAYTAIVPIGGSRILTKTFERKADAEDWEREQKRRQRNGELVAATSALTLRELAERWKETYAAVRLEPSSCNRYERQVRVHVLPSLGSTRLVDLRHDLIERWLSGLRSQGLSPKTCNDCLGLLRKILNDAVAWGLLSANPVQRVRKLRRTEPAFRYWTQTQASTFLEWAKANEPWAYAPVALALNTGMRLGEIAALQWDCVDMKRRQIAVARTWCQFERRVKETTKTNQRRFIPMNRALADLLDSLRPHSQDDFVLPRLGFESLFRRLQKFAKRAGVTPIRWHDLRHSFASMWMMSGQSMFGLQHVLGHTSMVMTQRYAHLAPDHLVGATDFLQLMPSQPSAPEVQAGSPPGPKLDRGSSAS